MVARMQKMKAGNLGGIGNHNQRKTDNHSNKDIDIERSHLNYDLVQGRTENYKTDIQEFIDENKSTSRAVRKDAVLVNEWIISSDEAFFEGKDDKEIERFFEQAKDYFADTFGDKNIRYAQVHLDETTPHMHLGVVPFDSDKKLSAKRVFDRQALRDVQDDLPRFLNNQGFYIERGQKDSERKNLTVPEYKKMKDDLKVLNKDKQEISEDLTRQKREVATLSEKIPQKINLDDYEIKDELKKEKVNSGEKFFWGTEIKKTVEKPTGNVVIPKKQLAQLSEKAEQNEQLKAKVERYLTTDLVQENKKIRQKYANLRDNHNQNVDDYNDLLEENQTLKTQVKSLKQEIRGIYQGLKSFVKEHTPDLKGFKQLFKGMAQGISKNVPDGEFKHTHDRETKQERSHGGRNR